MVGHSIFLQKGPSFVLQNTYEVKVYRYEMNVKFRLSIVNLH